MVLRTGKRAIFFQTKGGQRTAKDSADWIAPAIKRPMNWYIKKSVHPGFGIQASRTSPSSFSWFGVRMHCGVSSELRSSAIFDTVSRKAPPASVTCSCLKLTFHQRSAPLKISDDRAFEPRAV